MSKPHHEPRVITSKEPKRAPYLKPRSKISIVWDRLLYNVRYTSRHWKDRVFFRLSAGLLVYTVGLYVFIYKYYGSEHPLNRFQWRQMKKHGQLSEELLRKEEVVHDLMKNRFSRIYDKESPYSIRRQGPPGPI